MSERISRLCDELRIKLHGLDRRLGALKSNGVATFERSQAALEGQLDRVEQRIYDHRVAVEAANARAKTWVTQRKSPLHAARVPQDEKTEFYRLESEAREAETYASAAFELAAAAADEAILAVLLAVLACNRVDQANLRPTEAPSQ
ncbi:hypothetical protein [Microvirga pudoricolor]|uniref:hypothetical protein n=1 Tax=Microvirga pudoricolor TaxID=2778729 RepID=UPI0019514DAE|nr:hypothetical protein [Microvirga pudoricolor]MBM6595059.1 hypothetical protein [Microvirga pudoricolor]